MISAIFIMLVMVIIFSYVIYEKLRIELYRINNKIDMLSEVIIHDTEYRINKNIDSVNDNILSLIRSLK